MSEYICPNCKNSIHDDDALLCHFCGESLKRSSQGLMGKMKYGTYKWVLAVILAVAVLSFILLTL